jgi:hypothetical protein
MGNCCDGKAADAVAGAAAGGQARRSAARTPFGSATAAAPDSIRAALLRRLAFMRCSVTGRCSR